MSQTAAHLVDHVIPRVPVRQWVLSLPISLRVLLAAQPELVTPVLQLVQRMISRHLLDDAWLGADEGQGDAVGLIQRFGSAANLNIHLHCLVLDGVYRCGAEGSPAPIEADVPTDDEEARALRPLQAAAITYRISFGPRAGQRLLTLRGAMAREDLARSRCAPTSTGSACARRRGSMPTIASGWNSCAAT